MEKILLACDLDRTVLPNGPQAESLRARELFSRLVELAEVVLVYVSGRNRHLLQKAIDDFDLPESEYAIGDVGTTIYRVGEQKLWEALVSWDEAIAVDWKGMDWSQVKALFDGIKEIYLQDDSPDFQNKHKVSFYTATNINRDELLEKMYVIADKKGLNLSLIYSIDEIKKVGLLDVLPRSATKLGALKFLQKKLGFVDERVVFAGDSGNDIPVLTSGLPAVLVKNAREEVKKEVLHLMSTTGMQDKIYIAKGDFMGMNGNYAAGVVEGVVHYFPETEKL
ncbi:MAG: HAD-IIB family hydrolase [Candidatus Andersenbacteria bacterium]|nr:HAD-IIB family hydrolase [bacterium]MDZ4225771.1 HAD-IIB family hydrolase [Candidatus Andersenbacteria bacterium]